MLIEKLEIRNIWLMLLIYAYWNLKNVIIQNNASIQLMTETTLPSQNSRTYK